MTEPTPYELLGVSSTASAAEIRSAYRRLARQHHPDTGGAAADFAAITDAYDLLSDPARRARYDAAQRYGVRVPASGSRPASHAQRTARARAHYSRVPVRLSPGRRALFLLIAVAGAFGALIAGRDESRTPPIPIPSLPSFVIPTFPVLTPTITAAGLPNVTKSSAPIKLRTAGRTAPLCTPNRGIRATYVLVASRYPDLKETYYSPRVRVRNSSGATVVLVLGGTASWVDSGGHRRDMGWGASEPPLYLRPEQSRTVWLGKGFGAGFILDSGHRTTVRLSAAVFRSHDFVRRTVPSCTLAGTRAG